MPSAPVLDATGKKAKDVTLEEAVFGVELKTHLIHETVRAEMAAARAGTRGAKSRGMVAGGRAKPWRQKGTGRARQGTIRAPHFTGGGVAFPPTMRKFELKVNRKARRAALRSVLSHHARAGSLAVIDGAVFTEPKTRVAEGFLAEWSAPVPLVVIASPEETAIAKSFRNLPRVVPVEPSELEVGTLVWARSVLVTEAALPSVVELAR